VSVLVCGGAAGLAFASAAVEGLVVFGSSLVNFWPVKALPTTYIELIPAPGVGKAIILSKAVLNWNISAGAYTNVNADSIILLGYGDWLDTASVLFQMPSTASNNIGILTPPLFNGFPATGYQDFSFAPGIFTYSNEALKIVADNPSDFTNGNAANTLTVTVFYSIVNI